MLSTKQTKKNAKGDKFSVECVDTFQEMCMLMQKRLYDQRFLL
jgi:hypothetical protein